MQKGNLRPLPGALKPFKVADPRATVLIAT